MVDSGFFLNAAGISARLYSFADAIPTSGRANMEVATSHLEGEIKERSPVDTGHLRAEYSSVVETDGDTVIGHVGTNVPYALPQEMYYTPHVRPAVDANEERLVKIMAEDTLRNAISHL